MELNHTIILADFISPHGHQFLTTNLIRRKPMAKTLDPTAIKVICTKNGKYAGVARSMRHVGNIIGTTRTTARKYIINNMVFIDSNKNKWTFKKVD